MGTSYDVFTAAFLSKISEFEFTRMLQENNADLAQGIVDGYFRRAVSNFKKNCKYDLVNALDDEARALSVEISDDDLDELVEIISEGMVVQWLKPYVYQQENLQNVLSTRDFSLYSPANLLERIGNAYAKAQKDYTQMIREYSFNHGDLTKLHL